MKARNILLTSLILSNLLASGQTLVSSKLPKNIRDLCRANAQQKKYDIVPFMGKLSDELTDDQWESQRKMIAQELSDQEYINYIKNDPDSYRAELDYNSIYVAGDESETVSVHLSCNKGVIFGKTEVSVNMDNTLTQVFAAPALIRPTSSSELAFTGNYARLPMFKAVGRSSGHVERELEDIGSSIKQVNGQIVAVDNKVVLFGKSELGTPKLNFFVQNEVLDYVTSNNANNASMVEVETYVYDYNTESIKQINLK